MQPYELHVAYALIVGISVFCQCSLCKCLFAPGWISLTLMQITVARHLIFPFSLTMIYNGFLCFWASFFLLWRLCIVSIYSKFLKIFYGSHLSFFLKVNFTWSIFELQIFLTSDFYTFFQIAVEIYYFFHAIFWYFK